MLSKVCVPCQNQESPCPVKTILLIVSFFLSLALIITLFYTFFKRCDRLKFTFKHKCPKEQPDDTDIPLAADTTVDQPVD